jgi:hypothetical protein
MPFNCREIKEEPKKAISTLVSKHPVPHTEGPVIDQSLRVAVTLAQAMAPVPES